MKRVIFSYVILIAAALFSVTSCQKSIKPADIASSNAMGNSGEAKGAPLRIDVQPYFLQIEDANHQVPTGDATPLYNKNGGQHLPIMTPDGMHQVTLGEFSAISGDASIKCTNMGTHVVMHLKNLIPNGVYTIWTLTFKAPGYDGTFTNRIGFGALGAIEGDRNTNAFTADENGEASISVMRSAGHLDTDGSVNPHPNYEVPNCLADVFETHLALAYHLNNIPAAPGAPPTWVVQGYYQFWGSQL